MNRSYTKAWNILYSSKSEQKVNSEQIRFHQKGRVEAEERPLSQARALICPEENSPGDVIWNRTHPRIRTLRLERE